MIITTTIITKICENPLTNILNWWKESTSKFVGSLDAENNLAVSKMSVNHIVMFVDLGFQCWHEISELNGISEQLTHIPKAQGIHKILCALGNIHHVRRLAQSTCWGISDWCCSRFPHLSHSACKLQFPRPFSMVIYRTWSIYNMQCLSVTSSALMLYQTSFILLCGVANNYQYRKAYCYLNNNHACAAARMQCGHLHGGNCMPKPFHCSQLELNMRDVVGDLY